MTGALLLDTIFGRSDDRMSRTAVAEVRALQRGLKVAQEVGENRHVLDLGHQSAEDDALRQEEAELTARLEARRERRGG